MALGFCARCVACCSVRAACKAHSPAGIAATFNDIAITKVEPELDERAATTRHALDVRTFNLRSDLGPSFAGDTKQDVRDRLPDEIGAERKTCYDEKQDRHAVN